MNTIIESKSKLDELVQEGYKIIYPNSIDGLDFEVEIVQKHQFSGSTILNPIKTNWECKALNFYEKLFKYRGFLFLMPYHFNMTSVREYTLHFNKGEVGKDFNLKRISVVSDSRTSHPYAEFYEKINYILFNPQKNSLAFYVDDNFKSSAAKRAEVEKNKKQNLESKLEEDLQSLFD